MSTLTESTEWQDLRGELELIAKAAHAFNAYVFDAWDIMGARRMALARLLARISLT